MACRPGRHQPARPAHCDLSTEALPGLADGYVNGPQFAAVFQRIHPDLAPFMRSAIRVYCRGLEE